MQELPKKPIDWGKAQSNATPPKSPRYPAEWHWTRENLPRHRVRGAKETLPGPNPFDISEAIRVVCQDIVTNCADFSHVDMKRMIISFSQSRSEVNRGLLARLTPLRFPGGARECVQGPHRYRVQRYLIDGVEMRYLLTLCLPRFLNLSFGEKMLTLFHELYHIAPNFAGDLRQLPGRCPLHGPSKKAYDAHMARLLRAYLADRQPKPALLFLRHNFATLAREHGGVQGIVVPRPRSIPLGATPMSDICEIPLSNATPDEIRALLQATKVIAVVGLSEKTDRPSHRVAAYMQQAGYRIIPVNPQVSGSILGEKVYPSLKDIPEPVEMVDIFRRPDAVPEIVADAITIGAKSVWMQEGIVHNESAEKARSAGLSVVMDRCLLKEHMNIAS